MNRAVPALILCLAAVMALVLKAPPKVRENQTTYYKTLIQAPAARITVFTTRVERKQAPKPLPPKPAAKPASSPDPGPHVTVLGGIPWERSPHNANVKGSHSQTAKTQEHTGTAIPTVTPDEAAPVENTQLVTAEVAPVQSE